LLERLLAWWLRSRMQWELQPLTGLQDAIASRHATDLAPLPDAVTAGAGTREVRLVLASAHEGGLRASIDLPRR